MDVCSQYSTPTDLAEASISIPYQSYRYNGITNDLDLDGDALSLVRIFDAVHGTVELVGGEIIFTPDTNFFGDTLNCSPCVTREQVNLDL